MVPQLANEKGLSSDGTKGELEEKSCTGARSMPQVRNKLFRHSQGQSHSIEEDEFGLLDVACWWRH